MSNLKHRPILHMNGSGYKNLYEQYIALFETLELAEKQAYTGCPHARDYYVSLEHGLWEKARNEYRENVVDPIIKAKEYVHDLLLDIVNQNDEREARRNPQPARQD